MSGTTTPRAGSTPRHSVSVAGAVIDSEGRFLVMRRADSGAWELPGVVLELAETPEAGARREVGEETGVEVEVGGLSGVYKNLARGIVALVFRCRPVGGCPAGVGGEQRGGVADGRRGAGAGGRGVRRAAFRCRAGRGCRAES
ncbi:putative mutT-like protein [Streptomyces sp. Tu6071]|nr:putative mutT-like protein [Streptomyces sp. Tu6071]